MYLIYSLGKGTRIRSASRQKAEEKQEYAILILSTHSNGFGLI